MSRWTLLALALAASAGAQQTGGEYQRVRTRRVPRTEGMVTKSEGAQVFAKLRNALAYNLKVNGGKTPVTGSGVLSRREIVAEFARLRSLAAPQVKIQPRPVRYDAKRLAWRTDELESLVKGGFVAPYGPLTTGTRNGLTPQEFGDAIGFFVARLAEVTHQPSTKWTPLLQPDGG